MLAHAPTVAPERMALVMMERSRSLERTAFYCAIVRFTNPRNCAHEGCVTRPYFNTPGETK
eukprot:520119-Prorocentrum_minimum.AAC.1